MVRRRYILLGLGAAALLFLLLSTHLLPGLHSPPISRAAPPGQDEGPQPQEQLSIADENCLGCHGQPGITMELENGEVFGLYVPEEVYHQSVHGSLGYACVQCHTTVGNYPHPPFQAENARQVTLQLFNVCERCHPSQFALEQDSVHAAARAAGNVFAATCVDCHSAHAVQRLTGDETGALLPEARQWVPQTCAKCHFAIYERYASSVHGQALLLENNPDVPTCTDCHGVHNIEDPTTAGFRLRSPQICAGCHADPEIMAPYGISTLVLETYVADFHGTTVTLFEKQHPDQEVNQAVCYDCHGVHDIQDTDDPVGGLTIQQNILQRCQVCHPGATENFPDAWLSHYVPSPDRHPIVYTVNAFYTFFIPTVLGGMALLVLMDAGNLFRKRLLRRKGSLRSDQKPEEARPQPEGSETREAGAAGEAPAVVRDGEIHGQSRRTEGAEALVERDIAEAQVPGDHPADEEETHGAEAFSASAEREAPQEPPEAPLPGAADSEPEEQPGETTPDEEGDEESRNG